MYKNFNKEAHKTSSVISFNMKLCNAEELHNVGITKTLPRDSILRGLRTSNGLPTGGSFKGFSVEGHN